MCPALCDRGLNLSGRQTAVRCTTDGDSNQEQVRSGTPRPTASLPSAPSFCGRRLRCAGITTAPVMADVSGVKGDGLGTSSCAGNPAVRTERFGTTVPSTTTKGSCHEHTSGISDPGPIKHVQKGMLVIDANGEDVGTVAEVQMGDPQAVTSQGQEMSSGGRLLGQLIEGLGGGSSLPRQQQERLLRVGYVRIESPGGPSGPSHVPADLIRAVADGRVHLTDREAGRRRT